MKKLIAGAFLFAGTTAVYACKVEEPDESTSSSTSSSAASTSGSSSSTSSGGTTTSSGGGMCDQLADCDACVQCAREGSCATQYDACAANPDCVNYSSCADACTDQPCLDMCEQYYPNGLADYDALAVCIICGECPVTCDGPGSGCP